METRSLDESISTNATAASALIVASLAAVGVCEICDPCPSAAEESPRTADEKQQRCRNPSASKIAGLLVSISAGRATLHKWSKRPFKNTMLLRLGQGTPPHGLQCKSNRFESRQNSGFTAFPL